MGTGLPFSGRVTHYLLRGAVVMKPSRFLIKGIQLLDGDGTLKEKVDVRIEGQNIVSVCEDPLPMEENEELLEGRGCLLSPGLVNLHTHSPMGLMRGLGEDLTIDDWFNQFIWRFESKLTPADVKVGAYLGMLEMLENGVTAFADHYFFPSIIAQVAEEIGIRADIAPTIFGFRADVEEQLEEAVTLIKEWNPSSQLVQFRMGPHAPYTCPQEVLQKTALLARELGVGIHIHVSETEEQVLDSRKKTGQTPFQVLSAAGIFSVPVIVGHGLWIEEEDLELLSPQTYFAACPKTYLKLGMGFGRLWDYHGKLKIGIGTDGAASSGNLNPLEQVRLYGLIGKHLQGPQSFSLTELWQAVMQGHQALGLKSGMIRPGYRADVVIWQMQDLSFCPLHNPLAALLYSGEGRQVRDVMIDGKLLIRDGKFTRVKKEDILEQVQEVVEKVLKQEEGPPMAQY